jgi:murein hydrolase activator
MKFCILIYVFCFFLLSGISGQTKAELEEKRIKTLAEIEYVDNLLKTTTKEKSESLNAIKIIGNKLNLREMVLRGMKEEISLLNERISLNTIALDIMENDLINLRSDYEKAVINSYKLHKGNPELVYILSAKDFNQGYKRIKYLQQITKFRRRESEIIMELKLQIETSREKLKNDLNKISDLKAKEEQQKYFLQSEQGRKQKMVKSLNNKEKQLNKELEEKKKIARKIENEIAKIIEEERRRLTNKEERPEQKLIGDNFAENKGKLPWPVENGVITSQFGIHKHPVLKYLEEDNIGIEITSSGKVNARSVFNGEVARVFTIPGANMTVILKHGKYLSVYSNIINVKVKTGDKVTTKQDIGEVFPDPGAGFSCLLKFMIFETNSKYLDPEMWIVKK